MKIVMSSGHGKYVSGANDIIKEHEEAVRVVNKTAEFLRAAGVNIITYEDTVSKTQDDNLARLVDFHNSQGPHDLDVSIHFNANQHTSKGVGTECWHYSSNESMKELASSVAEEIAGASGLIDRGPKPSSGLYFLVHTQEPAVLVEVCFVDSETDCRLYQDHFDGICEALATALGGEEVDRPLEPEEPEVLFRTEGACSHFGGPNDTGVSASEGLAFIYDVDEVPYLFLPYQPSGTTGLARRLNPFVPYVACRWDYDTTPKEMLKGPQVALVRSVRSGVQLKAFPADWGPHEDTGRVADLSPGLMSQLDLTTDDEVEVIYPYKED